MGFLLEKGILPVTGIARETGFSGSVRLATAFRMKYGTSPGDLRTGKR